MFCFFYLHSLLHFTAQEISTSLIPISCFTCVFLHSQLAMSSQDATSFFFPARDKVLENKNVNSLLKSTPLCWPAELNSSGAENLAVFFLCASLSLPFNAAIISFYSASGPRCLVLWTVSLKESNLSGEQKQTDLRESTRLCALPPPPPAARLLIEQQA